MNTEMNFRSVFVIIGVLLIGLISCGPLNPINDFFGIQMNPTDEANFVIVDYSDIDGVTYKNSVNMNPKINAWVEFSQDEITLKVVNNSDQAIPLNYSSDQFILITDESEYFLGKGERSEYFKKGMIDPNTSEIFNLELPLDYNTISRSGSGNVDTRSVIRSYSKTEGYTNILKDSVKYIIAKFGKISIVLKKIPKKT